MEIFLCIFCCLFVLLLPCLLCFYLLPSIKRVDHKNNMIMQNLMERLRPLVGSKGWNYCILWTISEDQRFIEWMNCCCAGSEHSECNNNGCEDDQELLPVSPVLPCRDSMFHHPRTHACDLLSQLPISVPLDSGFYAQTLMSNQPNWLNASSPKPSNIFEEHVGTRVLVPLPGALIELFVAKQIPEDPNVIDFIAAQCSLSLDHHHQESLIDPSFIVDVNAMSHADAQPMIRPLPGNEVAQLPVLSPATAFENLHLSYDVGAGVDQANGMLPRGGGEAFFEEEMVQGQHMEEGNNEATRGVEEAGRGGRSNSMSDCSDQIDDEDDGSKQRRKSGKGQCKNLVAERKRRKKLNERLYTLRSLVPKISKLDRASILGDAIEYVKDLKRQEKELEEELEHHSDTNNDTVDVAKNNGKRSHVAASSENASLSREDAKFDHDKPLNGYHLEACVNDSGSRQFQDSEDVKVPQMEPQVEVAQIDGNEFFVKVFCEHKAGRFVRLMEAFNSLALEVTNANVTTFRNLVSNVLKVEKKDSKMVVQADHLRDFLLELTRNPSRGLSDVSKDNGLINNINAYHHHHPNY